MGDLRSEVFTLTTELDLAGPQERRARFPLGTRLLLAGELFTALGVGLTQPYAVVLLHDVRGLSLAVATGIWGLGPLTTIGGNAVAGPLIDRRGARFVMIAGLAMVIAGGLLLAYGPGLVSAVGGVAVGGLGWSFTHPALGTRLAILTPEQIRSRVYTIQYVFFNLGMAVGASIGGLVVAHVPPAGSEGSRTMPMLWAAAAGLSLVTITLAVLAGRQVSPGQTDEQAPRGGYRRAFTDIPFIRVIGTAALLSTVGYGIYNAVPAVMALAADDPAALSFASVANCAVIVIGSPLAIRLTERISARVALLGAAGLWALAWAICIPTALGTGLGTRPILICASVLIGAGELLLAGALPTLVNALAPDELRGRYNALSNLSLTIGMAAGPLLTSAAAAGGSVTTALYTAVALSVLAGALLLRPTGEINDR
ncbi:MFS transporter [Actinoplanes sp. HUAS TT8]|uniref:MFS transporter n=1 Tax=Actinoplanes sp. HUAS TT8 TaxID=3447453 RepID=UPI003F526CEB